MKAMTKISEWISFWVDLSPGLVHYLRSAVLPGKVTRLETRRQRMMKEREKTWLEELLRSFSIDRRTIH